ncbi:hypothetical protein BH09DEP1_BH09DEP1_8070 [soil metagenome]
MKALLVCIFLGITLNATGMEKTPEQIEKEQTALQRAGALKVIDGPDWCWHKINSFIQAVVSPKDVTYNEDGFYFFHYKRSYIGYEFSWQEAVDLLARLTEVPVENVEKVAANMRPSSVDGKITEFEKYRIARDWLYQFVGKKQNENADPNTSNKNYLKALHAHDFKLLSSLAKTMVEAKHMPLSHEIFRIKRQYFKGS